MSFPHQLQHLEGPAMEKSLENFKQLDQGIKKNFAEILLTTMDTIYKLYHNLKATTAPVQTTAYYYQQQPHPDGGKEQVSNPIVSYSPLTNSLVMLNQKLQELKKMAHLLVTFAGLIQYRLPGDTNATLTRMEVFMS
jgi:nuclear pore complex protein Nup93